MKLLSKLAVEGFRGMHDLKIDHLSQVNLIVGDNNCGKKACWKPYSSCVQAEASRTFTG